MKRHLYTFGTALLVLLVAASCTTVPVAQRERRVESLIEELNTAPVDRLVELSARPFLLDGEIIILEADLRMMWTNLRDVGFTFHTATIEELGPVTPTTYLRFADTMEVRTWFEKYAASDAGLAGITSSHGTFLIVTGDRTGRLPRIFGFTGPQERRQ